MAKDFYSEVPLSPLVKRNGTLLEKNKSFSEWAINARTLL